MDVDVYYEILNEMNMKYDNWHDINEFLLNTILVLSGARPSYRIDLHDKKLTNELISYVLFYYKQLSVIKYSEPLLFLTADKDFISTYENSTIDVGKVLGYCYDEFDWMNTGIDRLSNCN